MSQVRPGSVLAVPTRVYGILPVVHVGIVSALGAAEEWRVIHASRIYGQVVETPLAGFFHNATGRIRVEGYPGDLAPKEVLERALSRLGAPYNFHRYNCEHFVCEAHGLARRSPQWEAWRRAALRINPDPWERASPW